MLLCRCSLTASERAFVVLLGEQQQAAVALHQQPPLRPTLLGGGVHPRRRHQLRDLHSATMV